MKVAINYPKDKAASVKVSICYDDIWEMSQTLARIIYPLMKKYRKQYDKKNNCMGYPCDFIDWNSDLSAMTDEQEKKILNEWVGMLDKMVYSFKCLKDSNGWDGPAVIDMRKEVTIALKPHLKSIKKQEETEECQNGESPSWNRRMDICAPIYRKYQPIFDAHHVRVQEGLDLFAKYFGSFWI